LAQVRESTEGGVDELSILVNHVSPNVYAYIEESQTYANALEVFQTIFSKPKNEIFAPHLLAIRKQQEEESLEEFLSCLRQLSKDCNFKAVSADQNREDFIRDAFINGLLSNSVRHRLLESPAPELHAAHTQPPRARKVSGIGFYALVKSNHRSITQAVTGGLSTREVDRRSGHLADSRHRG